MSRLIAIDPGVKLCGWALFSEGHLSRCGLVRTKAREIDGQAAHLTLQLAQLFPYHHPDCTLIIERPEVYRQRHLKGDPNDLISIAIVVGAIMHTFISSRVRAPLPKEWKGQVPKEVSERRMMRKLSPEELDLMVLCLKGVPRSLRHNVTDAVALGQWGLGI